MNWRVLKIAQSSAGENIVHLSGMNHLPKLFSERPWGLYWMPKRTGVDTVILLSRHKIQTSQCSTYKQVYNLCNISDPSLPVLSIVRASAEIWWAASGSSLQEGCDSVQAV